LTRRIAVLGAAMLLAFVAAGSGQARTNVYLYPWPSWFKQATIRGCINSGRDAISCGCYLRALRARLTFAQAYKIEVALDNGDPISARARRIIFTAASLC
jgi:hypothetical protein